jgi:hypothetical protein
MDNKCRLEAPKVKDVLVELELQGMIAPVGLEESLRAMREASDFLSANGSASHRLAKAGLISLEQYCDGVKIESDWIAQDELERYYKNPKQNGLVFRLRNLGTSLLRRSVE